MPRILGVDIPDGKKVGYALQYIQGVGPARAAMILEATGIVVDMRARELNEEHINKITSFINSAGWKIEGDLRREIVANLKRLQAIKCYRGLRHYKGLPVRGQRTSTNARTRKGSRKTVGVMKKETK
jgi:small subunit ribosomal protein S13